MAATLSPERRNARVADHGGKCARVAQLLSVAQIAERVGYAEAKYFIAVFHRAVGTTPLRYRRAGKA